MIDKIGKKQVRVLLLLVMAVSFFVGWVGWDLPDPDELLWGRVVPSVQIVDRNGRLLYEQIDSNSGRNRPLIVQPELLQLATIAVEDINYYEHPGLDWVGIVRAVWLNLKGGKIVAGGSTITQQVTRLLLLPEEMGERSWRRKFRESWLALRINRRFSKDEILTLYLNQTYYGGLAYGSEGAAETFFGKEVSELSLAETALLAGLPQAPGSYNPFINPEEAMERRNQVLRLMYEASFINEAAYEQAIVESLQLNDEPYPNEAPHFVQMVLQEFDQLIPVEERGTLGSLIIYTTLDLTLQQEGERILEKQINQLRFPKDGDVSHQSNNGAAVVLDVATGGILALVGNREEMAGEVQSGAGINMAITPRQTGSVLKPFIYAAAFDPKQERPLHAASILYDVRTTFLTQKGEPYTPVNFSRQEHGPVSVRTALASSYNIPAVSVLDSVGIEQFLQLGRRIGFTFPIEEEYDLSLALGGYSLSLLELSRGYLTLANRGEYRDLVMVEKIETVEGQLIYERRVGESIVRIDPRVSWLISDILADDLARTPSFGQNSILQIGRLAAVKTGTTNDFRDNWTIGYTAELVVGVWMGNVDHTPMQDVSGISGAAPVWHQLIRAGERGRQIRPFERPEGMVMREVCQLSGQLPSKACLQRREEWFVVGVEPAGVDQWHQWVTIDQRTGLVADERTPRGEQVEVVAVDLPAVLQDWGRRQGLLLWTDLGIESVEREEELLTVRYPDPNMSFRISGALPIDSQKIRLEVVASPQIEIVSIWLDGARLISFEEPPYQYQWQLIPGEHIIWAEGRRLSGEKIISEPITFKVFDK